MWNSTTETTATVTIATAKQHPNKFARQQKTIEISNITDPILDEYVLQTKLSGNDGKRKKVQI